MRPLPLELTSFVGRDVQLVTAKDLLSSSRLVTLTGAGGCGKSRLAREVAAALESEFRSGVVHVDLTPLKDALFMSQAILQAAGILEGTSRAPEEALLAALRPAEMLLVLDNCEHIIDDCALITERVLKECVGLRVLATSRQPMEIEGEASFPVPPLSLPPPSIRDLTELANVESIQLFCDRAGAARHGFSLDHANAETVSEICRRVDGLPLGIELVAARMRTMSAEELLERLNDRLSLELSSPRAADPRHRTLRATIDWSHDLLSDPERVLFRRLAIFAGGWTLADAEAVCQDKLLDKVTETHSRLVEKSLVVGEIGEHGRSRYRFLETLRQYAGERLSNAGEERALNARHFAHFLATAEAYDQERMRGGSDAGLPALTAQRDNFRAALSWAIENDPSGCLRMTSALDDFWRALSAEEGWHWLQRTLPAFSGDESYRLRALLSAGMLAAYVPSYPEGIGLLRQAAATAERVGDRSSEGWAHLWLGRLALFRDDVPQAEEHLRRALAMHEEADVPLGRVRALALLGLIEGLIKSRIQDAEPMLEEALALAQEIRDSWGEGYANVMLGLTAGDAGDLRRSGSHCRAALAASSLGPILGVPMQGMAKVCVEQDPARAMRILGAAEAHFERTGTLEPPFAKRQAQATRLRAENLIGDEDAARAFADGRQMTTQEAVDFALAEAESAQRSKRLTAREDQVAALVARGKTNREIAAVLFISVRTVESHVDHILTKLDLSNRTQLAAWAGGSAP